MPQNLPETLLAQLRRFTVVVADTGDMAGDGEIPSPGRYH